jgi:sulfide:quinone oxidoreductase
MFGFGSTPPLRVVIVGGGVAGLETLLALHELAGDRVDATLVAPDPDFVYKPLVVGEPFSVTRAEHRALEPIAQELGARFILQAVVNVAPDVREVEFADRGRLPYDALVVCVGAKQRPAFRRAISFDATGGTMALSGVLADLEGGWSRSVAFVVPPRANWALPIYELALMTKRQAWDMGFGDIECTVITPEPAPLAIFGTKASAAVADLLTKRGIVVITSSYAHETDDGRLLFGPSDEPIEAERLIALPVPEGPRVPGLPADAGGFIPVDGHSRVRGVDFVYAAGDGTTFPIKQGGLATQQADAAAEHIAARAGVPIEPQPFEPILRGMLLTGERSLYMSQDPRGDPGEGTASDDSLWWPPHKISGRYLAPWLAREGPRGDPEPPRRSLDVEVALPREWHKDRNALDRPWLWASARW